MVLPKVTAELDKFFHDFGFTMFFCFFFLE